MYRGTIQNISGLGESVIQLLIEDESGSAEFIAAEGRLTVAALIDAFGDLDNALGQTIEYELTDFGSLAGFAVP